MARRIPLHSSRVLGPLSAQPEAASKFRKRLVLDALAKCGKAWGLGELSRRAVARNKIPLLVMLSVCG